MSLFTKAAFAYAGKMLLWSRILASIMVVSTLTSSVLANPTMREPRRIMMDTIMDTNQVSHSLAKRDFFNIQCKGAYDSSKYARLDKICDDCYNLFREHQIQSLCRDSCFTSDYFKGCIDVLLLNDEEAEIKEMIKAIRGSDPTL